MKWNKGNNKKPQESWDLNRQSGYDWDEEDSNEFSYEEVSDADEYEEGSMEPEVINVSVEDEDDMEFESLDDGSEGYYARETEYQPEHQSYSAMSHDYAQEPEYKVDSISYEMDEEYANEPDLHFDQDEREMDYSGKGGHSQVNSVYSTDYARDEGLVNEDDGYLPELSEEELRNGPGGGFLAGYGMTDDYSEAQALDSDLGLGSLETTVRDDGQVYVSDDDSWSEGDEQDPYLNNTAEARREQEVQRRRATAYNKRQVYVEDEQPYEENEQLGTEEGALYEGNEQTDLGDEQSLNDQVGSGAGSFDYDGFDGEILYVEEEGEEDHEEDERERYAYDLRQEERPVNNNRRNNNRRGSFGVFEGIMAGAGALVILLLVVFLIVVVIGIVGGKNKKEDPHSMFAGVGDQLNRIDIIGGKGIMAVANAELAKLTPELDPLEEEDNTEPENTTTTPEYNENDYKTTVKVSMGLTSVQKDLKIKFTNRETAKLIGNVRFVAEVTKPDGTVSEWIDTDMDGIIYEEGIEAGKYSVSLKELDDERYSNYILPASAQTVTVKKNIEYKKVDVTGEAKKDSDTNAGKEDTKKNETENESSLSDTVIWVASSVTGNTYTEILKSTIPDPLTLPIKVTKAKFLRTTEIESGSTDSSTTEPENTPTPENTPAPTEAPTVAPTEAPTEAPTVAPTEAPTEAPTVAPTEAPTVAPTEAPTIAPTVAPTIAPTEAPTIAPTEAPTVAPTIAPTEAPTIAPTVAPTIAPTVAPTIAPTEAPTIAPTVAPSGSPSALPAETPDMKLEATNVELMVTKLADGSSTKAETATINAIVSGYVSGKELNFDVISENKAIATAAVDANGKVTIIAVSKGNTKATVTVDYKNATDKPEGVVTQISKTIDITVKEKDPLAISFDKTEILCYSEVNDTPVVLTATLKNSNLKAADLIESKMTSFVVDSNDATVVQVSKKEFVPSTVDGTVQVKLTLAPQVLLEKKSTFVQVKYTEGEEDITMKCAITVKPHPKNDKVTPLLDKEGNQLFVMESDDKYRAAVYADYYLEGVKFFVQSGVKYTGWQTIDGKTYYFNAEGKFVAGEQVIQGAKYQFGPDGVLMSGQGVLGIDVSKWNGSINWTAVKNSGVTFVIIRCGFRGSTNGSIYEDSKFAANIKGATDAGLKVGVYFFTQAVSEVEAVYEASYVLERIKNYKITYPVYLDVEPSGGRGDKIDKDTRTKVCKAFCQTIQNSGYTAGIYANKTWLNEKINAGELNNYRIWLAQYASNPSYEGRYDMWQYKSTGTVNGISGNVDMNLSYMGY